MTGSPTPPDANEHGAERYEARPRWVTVLVTAAAVAAVLVLVLLLAGGGHGPGRHMGGQPQGAVPASRES